MISIIAFLILSGAVCYAMNSSGCLISLPLFVHQAAGCGGKEHKDFQKQNFKRHIVVMGPVQEMPVFEKMVEVDPVVKDFWGIPVARISGFRHDNDIKVAHFLADKAEKWLKEAGAIQTWQSV